MFARVRPGELSPRTLLGGDGGGHLIATGFTSATVNGTQIVNPLLAGTLRFEASTVVLPLIDPQVTGVVTAPFIFRGDVSGFARDDTNFQEPLFHVNLAVR